VGVAHSPSIPPDRGVISIARLHVVCFSNAFDRFLWAWFCGVRAEWHSALCIVKLETVIAWHRKGFRLFWTWEVHRVDVTHVNAPRTMFPILQNGPTVTGMKSGKLIETRSEGALCFQAASLYPLLYRLDARGWIQGRWVEKAGQRRRRYYRLTAEGRNVLAAQRQGWRQFVEAIHSITGIDYA
jgi:PadR family transcriptional regulator PadR